MTAISTSHNSHRRSRAPLEPFFSRAGITRVESRVVERVKKLCDRLKATQNTGEVVHLTFALSSLTTGMSEEALATDMESKLTIIL
jgi:cytochrome P450